MIGNRLDLRRAAIRLGVAAIAAALIAATHGALAQTGGALQQHQPATASPSAMPGARKSAAPISPAIDADQIVKHLNAALGLDLSAAVANWQSDLHRLETDLRRPHIEWSQLDTYRGQLQRLRAQTAKLASLLQSQEAATKAQLNLLGPAPAAGAPVPHQIALNRARLNYRLGLLSSGEAAVRSADLRVDNLFDRIESIRRGLFTSYLLAPIPGIYAYQTWSKVPASIPETAEHARALVANWWQGLGDRGAIVRIGFGAAFLFAALCFLAWRTVPNLRRWDEAGEPPFWRRASSAAGIVLLRALPVAASVVFAYGMIASETALPYRLSWLFYLSAESIVIVFTVGALVTTVFAPRVSRWRLIDVSDRTAARVCALVTLLAFVYGLSTLLYAATRLLRAPFALTIAVALPSSLLLAGIVAAILRTPFDGKDETAGSVRFLHAIKSFVWIIVAAIVVSALAGYLPLARFLAQQLIVTGLILALVYLLLLWADGFAQTLSDDGAAVGRWLGERGKLERARREQLALPIRMLLKVAVLFLAVPFILLQWGYAWPDIEEWYRQLFFGLHIGNTQVTFGALLASVIVFVIGYAAARLFQSWLDVRVLQAAGISGGVRHSIRTGVGYLGMLIAALAAFSYAGFSLSSLAIVAGAFSIGIGFGLQNVVNNFVSGLIMLVERPVRVGDLVVVGGEQGCVRKISVRSTEIETFDRSHVLIPNSSFISEKLENRTLRNRLGRVAVSVGADYESDPAKVKDLLLQVAHGNREVLKTPEPIVDLASFGGSSVNFVLHAFIELEDGRKTIRVRTDLSIAIFKAFAEAGIAMPFTQADIKIRDIDQVRDVFAGWASQIRAPAMDGPPKLPKSPDVIDPLLQFRRSPD
ncbi:MAG: mechanosensitive ion channel domain-containing protein [Bradyrhizobium sp.]